MPQEEQGDGACIDEARARAGKAGHAEDLPAHDTCTDAMSGANTATNSPAARRMDSEHHLGCRRVLSRDGRRADEGTFAAGAVDKALDDVALLRGIEATAVSRALTTHVAREALKNMRGTRLSGSDLSGYDLRGVVFTGADLRSANLCNCKLEGSVLPAWDSGLLEGVQLAGASGWMPKDRNLRGAKLRNANLRHCDLEGVILIGADLEGADMRGVSLSGADLQGARGGKAVIIDVKKADSSRGIWNDLAVHNPVVFALTTHSGLSLRTVTLTNMRGPTRTSDSNDCVRHVEVLTGPNEAGPFTSVFSLMAAKTREEQTFSVPDCSPLIAGWVKVTVHETYGGDTCLKSMQLFGEAWG